MTTVKRKRQFKPKRNTYKYVLIHMESKTKAGMLNNKKI